MSAMWCSFHSLVLNETTEETRHFKFNSIVIKHLPLHTIFSHRNPEIFQPVGFSVTKANRTNKLIFSVMLFSAKDFILTTTNGISLQKLFGASWNEIYNELNVFGMCLIFQWNGFGSIFFNRGHLHSSWHWNPGILRVPWPLSNCQGP